MTADGLPRELDEWEHVVVAAERKLAAAPFLRPDGARGVLEDVARERDGLAWFDWPREMPAAERRERVAALLHTTGLFAADGTGVRFSRPEVADYLVAHRIARRYPRARSPRAWKYLTPQAVWPWPDAGMQQVLAALWWRSARPVVERRIRRLLDDQHRDPNIRFVLDLVRRGLLPEVRERVLEVLRTGFTRPAGWEETVGWLFDLDAGQALTELESLARNPGPGRTDRRRLAAVEEITRHDELRGAKSLAILAGNLTGEPADRFATAVRIKELDRTQGERALRLLAASKDMGDLRADAVIRIGSAGLMREFVTAGYGLPDPKREEVLAALLGSPGADWSAAARQFAATAAEAGTTVRIAERVRGRDAEVALRILRELLTREDLADGEAGFRAAVLAGEIEPALAIPALAGFAALPGVSGDRRVAAGRRIVTVHGGSPETLVRLAEDSGLEPSCRGAAATAVREVDRRTAARLFIAIARTGSPTHVARLDRLRQAYECDPEQATPELAEVVGDQHVPGVVRLQAVAVARPGLSPDQSIAWYGAVVDNADDRTALTAAREVVAQHGPPGRRLLVKVAERPSAPIDLRITAAIEAVPEGVPALRGFAVNAKPLPARLTAAKELLRHDRSAGKTALRAIVREADGRIRIRAALALPGNASVAEALVHVAGKDRSPAVRFEAANTAMDYDPKLARPALQRLVDEPRTPERIRQQARERLGGG